MPARRMDLDDPLITCRYVVDIGGQEMGYFTEISGLQAEVEVFEYQEGGENSYTHKLPVRAKFSNITLKRGVVADNTYLWDWFKSAMQGQFERRHISIIEFGQDFSETHRWNIIDAYPVKWTLPQYKASENAVAVETLELAHRGFTRD